MRSSGPWPETEINAVIKPMTGGEFEGGACFGSENYGRMSL